MEVAIQVDHVQALLEDDLFRSLLESISDGAIVIDAQSRQIVSMNAVAREVLGYKESEVLGCQCRKTMNSPACTLACPLSALLEGERDKGALDLYYRGRDGMQMLHAHTRMLLVRGRNGEPLVGVEFFRDLREVRELQKSLRTRRELHGIIGNSEAMQNLYGMVEQLAPYDIPILLTGASGVGKERFADAIHAYSLRAERAFVKVNCAALSADLIESELFGHVRGAFTGANRDRKGCFEEAHGGTLLLDEVGDLPLALQAKLLRALQEGEVQRVGEDRTLRVDVRIIAATNRPLEADVEAGHFRQDLYYRLLGARLEIPPLCQHPEDIPLLAHHFLRRFAAQFAPHRQYQLADDAMQTLLRYGWPGNIRELENQIRLAAIRAGHSDRIETKHLSLPEESMGGVAAKHDSPASWTSLSLAALERQAIEYAMSHTQGNLSAAAKLLDIDRTTLWRKLKKMESMTLSSIPSQQLFGSKSPPPPGQGT